LSLENRLIDIEERLKIAECEHKTTELKETLLHYGFYISRFEELCTDCGKTLKRFSELDFYKEKLKRSQGNSEELKRNIKAIQEQTSEKKG